MPSTKESLLMLLDLLKTSQEMGQDDLFLRLQRHIAGGTDPTDQDWEELVSRVKQNVNKLADIVEEEPPFLEVDPIEEDELPN